MAVADRLCAYNVSVSQAMFTIGLEEVVLTRAWHVMRCAVAVGVAPCHTIERVAVSYVAGVLTVPLVHSRITGKGSITSTLRPELETVNVKVHSIAGSVK